MHLFSGGSQSHGLAGTRGANFASEDEQIDNLLRLFVAVDKKQSQEEVKEYFSKFGLVDHVHILKVCQLPKILMNHFEYSSFKRIFL